MGKGGIVFYFWGADATEKGSLGPNTVVNSNQKKEGGYYCCRKCKEEIRRLRREAQNKPVLRSQGHSQLQPLGHVRTQNST